MKTDQLLKLRTTLEALGRTLAPEKLALLHLAQQNFRTALAAEDKAKAVYFNHAEEFGFGPKEVENAFNKYQLAIQKANSAKDEYDNAFYACADKIIHVLWDGWRAL